MKTTKFIYCCFRCSSKKVEDVHSEPSSVATGADSKGIDQTNKKTCDGQPPSIYAKDEPTASENGITYGVDDAPPWYLCILFGFQQFLTMAGGMMAGPLMMSSALCYGNDWVAKSELFSTMFFASGIGTLIQSTLGVRLAIVQGMSFSFIPPALAIMSLDQWKCPTSSRSAINVTFAIDMNANSSESTADEEAPWKSRMREIQGALIVSAFFEVLIGLTGLTGLLMRFIGPLTVAPVITLIGIMLFPSVGNYCSKNWWMAILTAALITLFSQYLTVVRIPFFTFNNRKIQATKLHLQLQSFPVILSILISWATCALLTITNAVPDDREHWAYHTRVDTKQSVLVAANWFKVPYPFQYGWPTVSFAAVVGMMSAVIASVIESIGDYYACARISGAPVPPVHAINRGIVAEGIGCILSGMLGAGSGLTSYSENIGAIGITKVASRRVTIAAAFVMITLGILGKFGALIVTIPEPVIGGVFLVLFGMVTAVGISNLQFVDMNSSRNIFIFGVSTMFGLTVSSWMETHPDVIKLGVPILDQLFTVLTMTGIFVAGVLAFILDNTIPGTKKERGITAWHVDESDGVAITSSSTSCRCTYDLPFVTPFIRRVNWARYVPISPTFVGFPPMCRRATTSVTNRSTAASTETVATIEQNFQRYSESATTNV